MEEEKFITKINPFKECEKNKIPLWQCPSFLFFIMGLIIIAVIIITYFISSARIESPTTISLLVIGIAFVLLVINFIITKSFERIAEANRMKTEFINIVSHQLRSPLTNLKFTLQLLSDDKEKINKKEKEYFNILEENTEKMGDLINNLLTISRIERNKLPLRKDNFSLVKLSKEIVMKFKAQAEASNVKIKMKMKKNLPNVYADKSWLEQVIQNLLDNAVKYVNSGSLIEIRVKRSGRDKLQFEIEDNGLGIPKEEQKYIFNKFFRSKNVIKHQTSGSGLGLYICKKILSLMKGRIWFESKENKGATFYFTLPVVEAE